MSRSQLFLWAAVVCWLLVAFEVPPRPGLSAVGTALGFAGLALGERDRR